MEKMSISLKFVNFAHENHFIFIFCGKELIIFAPFFCSKKELLFDCYVSRNNS